MDEQPTAEGLYDAKGRWVPMRLIKPIDLERHHLVLSIIRFAEALSADLGRFKSLAMEEIKAFVELSAEQYGVTIGGTKGNITLMTFDGRYKIVRAMADRLVFDERLQVAKELVDRCITAWSEGSRDEIRALVEHAFQVDRQGKISTERVLGLRKLEIEAPEWRQAMEAISDSVTVAATTAYVRFYRRVGETDQYEPISLDLATVGAPAAEESAP